MRTQTNRPHAWPTATVVGDSHVLALCPAAGPPCVVVPNPAPGDGPVLASVNDDLSVLAITVDGAVRIFDVAAPAKPRATVKAWKNDMKAGVEDAVTFVAHDRMIVWVAGSPISSTGRLFDRDGKQLATIGPRDFTQNTVDAWPLDGSEWAFKQLDANRLVVLDVATGKTTGNYDLSALSVDKPTDPGTLPIAQVAAVGGSRERLVLVTSSGHLPAVGLLDRATGAIDRLAPPACP